MIIKYDFYQSEIQVGDLTNCTATRLINLNIFFSIFHSRSKVSKLAITTPFYSTIIGGLIIISMSRRTENP